MRKWDKYYFNKLGKKLDISNLILHWDYLLRIILAKPKSVIEIGCGPASHSYLLKCILSRTRISLLDNNCAILEANKKEYRSIFTSYHNGDILKKQELLKIEPVDLVISQGLMEHFNNEEIMLIISNFRGLTKRMIFSVPSENYPNRDFGNEVLRSRRDWENILSSIRQVKYSVKYNLDFGLRTKIQAIIKHKGSIYSTIRYLLTGSNHIIVELYYL